MDLLICRRKFILKLTNHSTSFQIRKLSIMYPKHLAHQIHLKRGRRPKQHNRRKKVIKVDTSDGESSEDEATNQNIAVPSEKERQKLLTNPLQIVFITKAVKKCSGCNKFFEKDHKPPKDMLFMTRMHRNIPVKQKGQDKAKWVKNLKHTPAYFHMCDFCLHE